MIQTKLSKKNLEVIIDTYIDLVNTIDNVDVRAGLQDMIEEMGERLFAAPASNRLEYHNCFVGGLVEHSLRVYTNLEKLSKGFASYLSNDSIILVSLAHDLGKLGSRTEEYYVPQDSSWHKEKLGEYYKINPELEYLGTAQRSLRLVEQFRIPTTDLEYKAILLHDGQYIDANKPYQHKEGMIGLLLHQADMIACKIEKQKWERIQ